MILKQNKMGIAIISNKTDIIIDENNSILSYDSSEYISVLGNYKSKMRATEVLLEIFSTYENSFKMDKGFTAPAYRMPLE